MIRWYTMGICGAKLAFYPVTELPKSFPKLCFWTNHTETWAYKLSSVSVSRFQKKSRECPPRAHYLSIKCKLWKLWIIFEQPGTYIVCIPPWDFGAIFLITHVLSATTAGNKHKIIFQKFIQQRSYSKPKAPLTSKCSKLFLQRSNCEFVKPSRSAKASIIKVTTERSRVWIEPRVFFFCFFGDYLAELLVYVEVKGQCSFQILTFKRATKNDSFERATAFWVKQLWVFVLSFYGFLGCAYLYLHVPLWLAIRYFARCPAVTAGGKTSN